MPMNGKHPMDRYEPNLSDPAQAAATVGDLRHAIQRDIDEIYKIDPKRAGALHFKIDKLTEIAKRAIHGE